MSRPNRFTWIERPYLAAMARPADAEELMWLRRQGIQLLISLSESAVPRHWINDTGMMALHVPVADMDAPTAEQLEQIISAIHKAHSQKIGAAIHCTAGLGRTGTALAAYFVDRGLDAKTAIARVRELRPGSIETASQEEAVAEFSRQRQTGQTGSNE